MAILNQNSDVIHLLITEFGASADKALKIAILNKRYDLTMELLDKYPASLNITNIPNIYGVTLIHRLVRDGAVNVVELLMKSIKESEVVLNPDVFFTLETLRSCTIPSEISKIDSIQLEQLSKPFYVGQNNCNTIIIWEDGTQMVFRNTDAGIVYDRLYARLRGINLSLPSTDGHELLTFFGSPGHFFLRHPEEGVVGFYPTEALTSDAARVTTSISETTIPACIWAGRFYNHYGMLFNDTEYEKTSDQKNHPKITIHIRKKDALAVARRIKALRHSCEVGSKEDCIYNTATNNCIVRAKQLCGEIPCARFLTDEQLAVGGFKMANIAHTYERVSRIVESEPMQNAVTVVESVALALVIAKITKSSFSWLYRR